MIVSVNSPPIPWRCIPVQRREMLPEKALRSYAPPPSGIYRDPLLRVFCLPVNFRFSFFGDFQCSRTRSNGARGFDSEFFADFSELNQHD